MEEGSLWPWWKLGWKLCTEGFFSQKRSFTKPVAHFSKVGGRFFPKSVTDFLKVGGRFSQSRWQIFPKSVADFSKVGDGFPQSRWQMFPTKSVAVLPKISVTFFKISDRFSQEPSQFFPNTEPLFANGLNFPKSEPDFYRNLCMLFPSQIFKPKSTRKVLKRQSKTSWCETEVFSSSQKAFVLSTNKFLTLSLIWKVLG